MSLVHDAKMPSLKDKLAEKADEEKKRLQEPEEQEDVEEIVEQKEKPKRKGRVNKQRAIKDE